MAQSTIRTVIWLTVVAAMPCSLAITRISSAQKGKLPSIEGVSPIGRWSEFAAGQKRRVHLWYEDGVWHFRCTCGTNATIFDGTATVDKGSIQIVDGEGEFEQRGKAGKLLNPKNSDYVQPLSNGVAFRFQCVGKLNGLDFMVPKEAKFIRFEFAVNNESKAEYIFLGASGKNPSKSAFTLAAHPK